MPGPVSDSYDPEFGTSSNIEILEEEIQRVRDKITYELGSDLKHIIDVCYNVRNSPLPISFGEKDLRIIRFCLDRAKESI